MRLLGILVLMFLVCADPALAQQTQSPSKTTDPFDLTSAREKLGKLGIPTQSSVAELESKAKALVAGNDCRSAVPALEIFARQANTLANLISAGLQPFYGASYDDQRKTSVGPLVKYESLANDYKAKRNRAIVLQAECTAKLGQRDQAATLFIRDYPLDTGSRVCYPSGCGGTIHGGLDGSDSFAGLFFGSASPRASRFSSAPTGFGNRRRSASSDVHSLGFFRFPIRRLHEPHDAHGALPE